MPNPVVVWMARPAIARWLSSPNQAWRSAAVPPGEDSLNTLGVDPDRVLLIGSGIAVGYGLTRHDDALAGHLAQRVSALTGRGASVDVLTSPNMTAERMTQLLDRHRLDGLDAIVATPLGIESLLVISRARWRRHLRHLLEHLSAAAPASVQLYLVAVPQISDLTDLPPGLMALSRRAHRRLNIDLERFCASHPQATFVPLPHLDRVDPEMGSRFYADVAESIAPAVARGLDEQFPGR